MFQLVKQRSFVDVKVEQSSAKGRGVGGGLLMYLGRSKEAILEEQRVEGIRPDSEKWKVGCGKSRFCSLISHCKVHLEQMERPWMVTYR